MSCLTQIENRHRRDAWEDVFFIIAAVLFVAVSIGGMTSRGAGKPIVHEWTVTVVEGPVEIGQ